MNFRQCLRYLEKIQKAGIKFGLDNVRTVLAALNNPHKRFSSVLVAGSNGKGSVCAMLTQILSLHGYRVGLYTSPHLVCYEERIRIGEKLISKQDFSRLLTVLKKTIDELIVSQKLASHPTHFELLTCLALLYFRVKEVDLAVLEVGMGGRFDATNIVVPEVSVITSISAEHQKTLGNSLSEIAFEKAGIIKSGVPVVCGAEAKEAVDVVRNIASMRRSPFIHVFEKDTDFKATRTERGYTFSYQRDGEVFVYSPSLAGKHQGKNAAVAIESVEQLSKRGTKLKREKIIQGIESTRWAGRLEFISEKPLILIDGAHNEEGAQSLRQYIEEVISLPVVLVFAVMQDKRIDVLADILFPLAEKVILTRFPYYRAASPEEIRARAPKYLDRILIEPDVLRAVSLAIKSSRPDRAVVIAGSLFLAGEVKKLFRSLSEPNKGVSAPI